MSDQRGYAATGGARQATQPTTLPGKPAGAQTSHSGRRPGPCGRWLPLLTWNMTVASSFFSSSTLSGCHSLDFLKKACARK